MLQTKQRTDSTRRTGREQDKTRDRRERSRFEADYGPVTALQAILAGSRADQIPAEAFLQLSHIIGNAALTEALSRMNTGPELVPYRPPETELGTEPFDWGAVPSDMSAAEAPALPAPASLPAYLPAVAV